MDDQVKAALAKWPDVPDCTGWLALDARGRWRVGEAKAGRRQPIAHAAMVAFINRNYAAHGRYWIFQNGPQRVFVELEYTPFVWRLLPGAGQGWNLVAHTGIAMTPTAMWLDSDGRFLFEARGDDHPLAIGVLHDHDTALVAEQLRGDGGMLLDDDALASLSSGSLTDLPTARLQWRPDMPALSLRPIASHQVAQRFGFEPNPATALRVDVDTRR
jgi:hypothetical protein